MFNKQHFFKQHHLQKSNQVCKELCFLEGKKENKKRGGNWIGYNDLLTAFTKYSNCSRFSYHCEATFRAAGCFLSPTESLSWSCQTTGLCHLSYQAARLLGFSCSPILLARSHSCFSFWLYKLPVLH